MSGGGDYGRGDMVRHAGFSPSREVVDMHRKNAPWLVDPALFVRVFVDAFQDASASASTAPSPGLPQV